MPCWPTAFPPGLPRARAANLYEVVKLLGMVMGAGRVGLALRPCSAERLTLVVGLWMRRVPPRLNRL